MDALIVVSGVLLLGVGAVGGGLWAPWETAAAWDGASSAAAARAPGLLACVATAWLTWRLGRSWLSPRQGAVAAAIVLTSPLVFLQGARAVGRPGQMLIEAGLIACVALIPVRDGWKALLALPIPGLWLLGGFESDGAAQGLDVALRHLGLGLYPWSALLPVALGAQIFDRDAPKAGGVATAWAFGGFLACGVSAAMGGPVRFTSAPAVALVVSAYDPGRRRPAAAVVTLVCLGLMGADLIRDPVGLLALVGVDGAVVGDGLPPWFAVVVAGWAVASVARRRGVEALVGLSVALALTWTLAWMRPLSDHLSRRGQVDAWRSMADGAPLIAYKQAGRMFHAPDATPVETLGGLRRSMTGDARVFALIPRDSLATVDRHLRRDLGGHVPVLEDSSSLRLLVSNRLDEDETDLNPLSGTVRPTPAAEVGRPLSVTFAEEIRLLGAEVGAAEVEAGGSVGVTLHFHAPRAPARRWQVFYHVESDAPPHARLQIGGSHHEPVEGVYPTDRWARGDHVADAWSIRLPGSAPAGGYKVYAGLSRDGVHAKAAPEDAHDGDGRVLVAEIRVIPP